MTTILDTMRDPNLFGPWFTDRDKLAARGESPQHLCFRRTFARGKVQMPKPMAGKRQELAGLSERQRRAIEALLLTPNVAAAAKRAGVGERTLWRWLKDGHFQDAYRVAGRERLSETVSRLRAAAGEAVETLRTALTAEHTANRIRAAPVLLEHAVKVEMDELADRISALEAAAAARERS